MQKRTITERVSEQEKRLAAMMQKLQEQRNVLKQLKTREENENRKFRNHMLIVAGAEMASLYEVSFLGEDEIHKVVNFLRDSKNKGVFDIKKQEVVNQETEKVREEKMKEETNIISYDDDFIF